MNKSDIICRLEQSKLDKNEYWVLAGSAMVLHEVKNETNDIDLGCTREYADKLEKQGYLSVVMPDGTRRITYDKDVDIFEDWIFDKVILVEGIPVISLNGLLEMKRSLGRKKDEQDILLIEEYVKQDRNIKRK